MTTSEIRELIKQELPRLVKEDPEIHALILHLSRKEFAPKQQTEDRFDRILAQLERDREEESRRWEEQNQRWKEQNQRWEENTREQNQRWEENTREQNQRWEEQNQRWEEQNQRWEENSREQNRRWEENRREFDRVHEEIMALARKHDRTVGALGARWGLSSEKAFRDALTSILEQNFGVRVLHIDEYDDQGTVFGRPEQVELDVVVTNGSLIVMELKSSMTKADMYIFERKVRFYEQRQHRKADRLMVISPMIDPRAQRVGERLGIEMFTDSLLVESL